MEPRTAASHQPDPEAVEFIRFCYQRRRVGWPELYDEMCAVAARGLYRGYGSDDLAQFGIGFSLFEMPSLAATSARVVAEEQARRRPVSVTIRADVPPPQAAVASESEASGAAAVPVESGATRAPAMPVESAATRAPAMPVESAATRAPAMPVESAATRAPAMPVESAATRAPAVLPPSTLAPGAAVEEIVVKVPIAPVSMAVPVRSHAVPVMDAEPDRATLAARLTLAPTRA